MDTELDIVSGTTITPYDGEETIKLEGPVTLPRQYKDPSYPKDHLTAILATLRLRRSLLTAESLYLSRYLSRYSGETPTGIALPLQVKVQLASRDYEDFRDWVSGNNRRREKELSAAELALDEHMYSCAEIRRVMNAFTREVLSGHEKKAPTGERVLKFMEDEMRFKATVAEKLRLRSSNLRRQVYKLQLALKQKEGSGEVMHAIDFEQLKIDNQRQTLALSGKNAEMLELKSVAARFAQELNMSKHRLDRAFDKRNQLRKDLDCKYSRKGKLQQQLKLIDEEMSVLRREHASLVELAGKWEVPSSLDYARLKLEIREQERKLKHLSYVRGLVSAGNEAPADHSAGLLDETM